MTVKELIEELQKHNPDAEVLSGISLLCPITDVASFVCEDNGMEYVQIKHSNTTTIEIKRV